MKRCWWQVAASSVAALVLVGITAPSGQASGCGPTEVVTCTTDGGGAQVELSHEELARARQGLDLKTGAPDTHSYEYSSDYACAFSQPDHVEDRTICMGAYLACAGNTAAEGQGPQVMLFRRELDPAGKPITAWTTIGTTCHPELVPGKPVLGLGPILAAFHNTAFTKPTVHIQPEGNLTLVTLATYFEVTWPAAGFKPGEIDTTTLLGYQVRIRPTVQGYTYLFGDGTSLGPTTSSGGIYPDGDITHTYPTPGLYPTRIDITYSGEFSVNAGAWIPIPDTVTIAGAIQPLTVKTAHARLVAH